MAQPITMVCRDRKAAALVIELTSGGLKGRRNKSKRELAEKHLVDCDACITGMTTRSVVSLTGEARKCRELAIISEKAQSRRYRAPIGGLEFIPPSDCVDRAAGALVPLTFYNPEEFPPEIPAGELTRGLQHLSICSACATAVTSAAIVRLCGFDPRVAGELLEALSEASLPEAIQ